MNVCIISSAPFPPREGIGNYIFNLSKNLSEEGHEITLMTRGGLISKKEYFEDIKIFKPIFIPCYPLHVHFHKIFVDRLFHKIESRFDIVHIHTPLAPIVSTRLPMISTVHTPIKMSISNFESTGAFSHLSRYQSRISTILEHKLLNSSDTITAVSNSVANELAKEYGIQKERIEIINNGVNETIFEPNYNNEKNEKHEKYILTVGRLAYRKGLLDFIECGKYVCNRYSDIKFIIVGEGILRNRLQRTVKNFGLENRFIFKGHVTKAELIRLYQNATVYVMPSYYEGLPTVLLEAMSCGLPVVATAVSGNVDVVSSGKNGMLVPPKSPKDLANAISILLDNDDLRKKLGKNARKTVEENYTWKITSDKIMEIYNHLL